MKKDRPETEDAPVYKRRSYSQPDPKKVKWLGCGRFYNKSREEKLQSAQPKKLLFKHNKGEIDKFEFLYGEKIYNVVHVYFSLKLKI